MCQPIGPAYRGARPAADQPRRAATPGASSRTGGHREQGQGRADAAARRSARAQCLGDGLVLLSCSVASVLMLPATAPAVADGTIPPPVVAALVLLPLALIDPMLGAVDALQQWPALATSLRRVRAGDERAQQRAGRHSRALVP